MDTLKIADYEFHSRLFTGTGKYSGADAMIRSVLNSGSEMATLSLRRMDMVGHSDNILEPLQQHNIKLLPNTSGARDAAEAVMAARIAREALETNWVKLEIHPDPRYLMPDPVETLKAAEELVKLGFVVMPYVHADPVLCKRLEEAGCQCVMPLAAPIGTNRGLAARPFLEIIIEQASVPVIVDAGIGAPSHACEAMEMGADAVLVNTAMAVAGDTAAMAQAFRQAVGAGRTAWLAGLGGQSREAVASSPVDAFLEQLV